MRFIILPMSEGGTLRREHLKTFCWQICLMHRKFKKKKLKNKLSRWKCFQIFEDKDDAPCSVSGAGLHSPHAPLEIGFGNFQALECEFERLWVRVKGWWDLIKECESNPTSAKGRKGIVAAGQPAISPLERLVKARIYLPILPEDLTMLKFPFF